MTAWTPLALAMKIRFPGSSTSDAAQVAFRVTVLPTTSRRRLRDQQVDRRRALVRDLDELVRGRRSTGLDLRNDERGRRPTDIPGTDTGTSPPCDSGGEDDDDERGQPRAPGTSHW